MRIITVNIANWERVVRIVLGIVLLYLGWAGVVSGTLGDVLKVLGFIPLVTGLIGWCPLYSLFRFSTRRPSATTR
jgi:hypothetical protein